MKRGFATLLALLASAFVLTRSAHAADTGIRVSGGRLVETNGDDLVLRGINHAYTWFPGQTNAFADIKATGANSVRVPLGTGQRWTANTASDVIKIITLCKRNKLICVLDAHDTSGWGEQSGAASMAQAVDFWLGLRGVLIGQENYVIINVADEPSGNNHADTWVKDTSDAIRRLRAAGLKHTLMVDAPDWGQDISFTMRDKASLVLAADPTGNTVFSVHMYGIFDTDAKVRSYFAAFANRRIALVVGEFGFLHTYGDPDEDAIMFYAQARRFGYLAWSWSGNTDVPYLDMVHNFDAGERTGWGDRVITGVDGLSTTSREASVYRLSALSGVADRAPASGCSAAPDLPVTLARQVERFG
jgi:mannan endo-1,4-beta-mannosidase